jgi:hypothetical protein
MVTPEAPVKAVKSAQLLSDTMARPPRSQPSSARVARTRRSGARLSPST